MQRLFKRVSSTSLPLLIGFGKELIEEAGTWLKEISGVR